MIDSYSPYARYTGQSVGRILHFIYHYCNPHIAELCHVGEGTSDGKALVCFGKDRIASYTWSYSDIPVFSFFPDQLEGFKSMYDFSCRSQWEENQAKYVDHVAYPSEYLREHAIKLKKFKELLSGFPDGPPIGPGASYLEKVWHEVINNLPIDLLRRYRSVYRNTDGND